MISAYMMYRKIVESKKIGPIIGMSPRIGILIAAKVLPVFRSGWGTSTRSFR